MPFSDPVSSVSGRNSRASNVSAMTGNMAASVRSGGSTAGPSRANNDTLSNTGVLSMLKTGTDTGDIGDLSFNRGRLPAQLAMPRATHQRRMHAPRPSAGSSTHNYPTGNSSHHYAASQASRVSDSTSYARRGSFTSMQSMPPSLLPNSMGKTPLQMPAPTLERSARDSRSYSLTSALPTGQLPRQRSAMSLKSDGGPRNDSRLQPGHPPLPENRPPYVYPTRLKRPGYRSPSPALSELSAGPGLPPPPPPHQRRVQMPMQRPPLQTYNSDYAGPYAMDPAHLNVRPPTRSMNVSPVSAYEQPHFGYQQPGAMRSAPAVHQMPPVPPVPPHPSQRSGQYPVHGQPYQLAQQGYNPYGRSQYGSTRTGYPPHAQPMHYQGQYHAHRGPPVQTNMAPMAHSVFHNAARLARNLPQRTDTPLTDVGAPSLDPPSSGTAPSSSNPPTPKDQTSSQVVVDPIFIDPALTDLPDSSSESVLPAKYFEYADGLSKSVEEVDLEIPHPSVPPTGFVQRVKAMLESKAATEVAAMREAERNQAMHATAHVIMDQSMTEEPSDSNEVHELAANETPRFTLIEEFEAPVELPASPVKLPELSGSSPVSKQRLTRDMVKAELSPTSTADEPSTRIELHAESTTDKDISYYIKHQKQPSKTTANIADTTGAAKTARTELLATPSVQRQNSTSDSAVNGTTNEAAAISGIDYALRFSVPVDTTTSTSEETQSRDPFVLDADTITLEHQRSREPNPQSQLKTEVWKEPETPAHLKDPVSPMGPSELVNRSSAVSPLQTQTLGIDETLKLGTSTVQAETTSDLDSSALEVTTSSTDAPPPPTPRTPKTYSKSVQLPSSPPPTGTPSTNRYSLPQDLSAVGGETTTNTNSDMITDIAVRFSLPNTTISIAKPQIVTIPPTSSPEKEEAPPSLAERELANALLAKAEKKSARRNSVTFADQVVPLTIKKPEPKRDMRHVMEGAVNKGKSIMRRTSPLEESTNSTISRESTTELRFPGPGRFGSTHLPGLKEESVEDMSINEQNRRSSSRLNEPHQLALPARIAAVKAMQERRLQESADKARARRAARKHNRPLAEIRDLPSLKFSQMDLIDRLNEALELDVKESKSMELVRRPREFSGIYCPSPQRPQSTEPLRDRYMSFFSKPEEFSFLEESEDEDEHEVGPIAVRSVPTVEVQESTKVDVVDEEVPGSRPLSPEDFLNVATQINRLSIPSVTGLSDRLTSLLPCLKNLHLDSILANDEEIAHTIDDIHALGGNGRPETVLSTRTSAGFRTLAERAEEIVKNDLPPLPESASADKVSAMNSIDGKQSYLSGSVSAPSDLGFMDPARPPSALVRQRSPTSAEEVNQMLPPEMNPITRGKRSVVISSAGSNVPVDLTIPSEAHTTEIITRDPLRRMSKSVDWTSSRDATDGTRGIDIGSLIDADSSASVTTEAATGVRKAHSRHLRKLSSRSIIGSLSRKIKLTSRNNDEGARSALPSPAVGSDNSLPHKPGDRYPTTSLTPPINVPLDEVRSFFSDDSSERNRRSNTRLSKRFTERFKPNKTKTFRLDSTGTRNGFDGSNTTRATTSLDIGPRTSYDAGSMNSERERAMSSASHLYDGVGMGKAEFHFKRFGEKLRHFIAKSGELIRSFSGRSRAQRPERAREDWLSDSLFSGV
ncbi:hypothetical protein KC365_g3724 [Hortaea werneckii]|nr:hypothetical protein KC342_g6665 [Hortaea werneckii]KAI7098665.1 hypothetical protein KC339_g8791 [Hortaea werneckii]KAI7240714.1 hypothetical protein KC365_g3724 [Hortaea werneckii]KAI7487103.1 hypothetical protein KC351_g2844 [Hortaea werneckii]